MENFDWNVAAIVYEIGNLEGFPITIERVAQDDGTSRWAVRHLGYVMTKKLEFIHEPRPSSRTKAFYKRARFLFKTEALEYFRAFEAKQERLRKKIK